jgi:hypothetical protein
VCEASRRTPRQCQRLGAGRVLLELRGLALLGVSENERDRKDPALDRYHGVDAEHDDRHRAHVSYDVEPERVPPQSIETGGVPALPATAKRMTETPTVVGATVTRDGL